MDDKTQKPYGKRCKTIYDGLGVLDYYVVPHYKSKHPETKLANKSVKYFKDRKIPFKTMHDGEVIIIE
jgi:dipeptidase E